jgi:hypothetical protein
MLVIDDAWRVRDLAPFLHRGPSTQTTRLVTTRDERVLPQDAARIAVGAMRTGEAQEMLSRFMPTPMPPTLRSRLPPWSSAGQLAPAARPHKRRGARPNGARLQRDRRTCVR